MSEIRVGIVGAGNIAEKHLEVIEKNDQLRATGIYSRTFSKAEFLANEFNIKKCFNKLSDLMEDTDNDALLILVSADQIFEVTKQAIMSRKPLFIEKPPGLTPKETRSLAELAENEKVPTMVGFNRRFYSVFHKGLELIKNNGDLVGIKIDGHERFWKLAGKIDEKIRDKWIYANSTHTIDLLRFFGGEILDLKSITKSRIEKNGDQFAAIMEFEGGVIGNYSAHWYSPGGWGVTLYGTEITVEFKPLEKGIWYGKDFIIHEVEADEIDRLYKPGFYKQMEEFSHVVRERKCRWPAQNLFDAYKTMQLANQLTQNI